MSTPYDGAINGRVDASGECEIQFGPQNNPNAMWSVSQISSQLVDAPPGSTCKLYKNSNFISDLVPTGDAADGTPLPLWPGDKARVIWTGCTPDSFAEVYYIYELLPFGAM